MSKLPKLYTDLGGWWPLLSAPEDYAEEAEFFRRHMVGAVDSPPRTMLELGCGGGNNASFLKAHFEMTLTDLSPQMVEVSRRLNPECEHLVGDMRSIRLKRLFDAVFVHDAIDYMARSDDLQAAIDTAFVHCRPGGVALFAPDHTRENFRPATDCGGHDQGDRGLRYLQWDWDADPSDSLCTSSMVYVLREGETTRCIEERHEFGLFSEKEWLHRLEKSGFVPRMIPFVHSEVPPGSCDIFLALKPRL